jgi:Triosephosphate isomerase
MREWCTGGGAADWAARLLMRASPDWCHAQNGKVAEVAKLIDMMNGAGDLSAKTEVVVAPTFLHIGAAKAGLRADVAIAAQNAGLHGTGAFTGEVGERQTCSLDCSLTPPHHVCAGERRAANRLWAQVDHPRPQRAARPL